MTITAQTAGKILSVLCDGGEYIETCSEYGEPGYSLTGDRIGIAFGNWNHAGEKYPRIMNAVGEFYELEWSDEWMVDYDSDKCYRTQGDSYSWQPSVILSEDCEWLTPDSPIDEWIAYAVNNPRRCIPSRVFTEADLEAAGFIWNPEEDYRSGWYGVEDSPQEITEGILRIEPDAEIVFYLTGNCQFETEFRCYTRLPEAAQERADWFDVDMAGV